MTKSCGRKLLLSMLSRPRPIANSPRRKAKMAETGLQTRTVTGWTGWLAAAAAAGLRDLIWDTI